jgi:predicted Zn-dependent protease with MMP-like domain
MPLHNTGGLASRQPGPGKTGPPPLACQQPRRPNTRRGPAVVPLCATMGLVIEVEPDRFEEMVVTALDGLPDDLGRLMRNVAVTVEHDAGPPGLLGLYRGVPLTSRTTHYAGVLPDRITIYRRAICAVCRTEEDVAVQVRRTVVHEVAHHFGIDDHRLRELGW